MLNDPFWGFSFVRATMGKGGRGPTWALLVLGMLLIALGVAFGGKLLVVMGVLVAVAGVWPLVSGLRSRRMSDRLAEQARREDEILEAAHQIGAEAVGASAGRGALAALIAADPSAAEVARRDCLRRAAAANGEERDGWLDAANEIGHLRSPEEISG